MWNTWMYVIWSRQDNSTKIERLVYILETLYTFVLITLV